MTARAASKAPSVRTGASSAAGAGAAMRAVLFDPSRGFAGAQRSDRSGIAAVLAGIGGAAAMLLWLKVGVLVGGRGDQPSAFKWSYVAVSLLAGAVAGIVAQRVWSGPFRRLVARDGESASQLRWVWGLSCVPHVAALLLLLPLDVAVAGSAAFTTRPLSSPSATVWTAVSIALGVSLACWSAYLFVVGTRSGLGWSGRRRVIGIVAAVGSWVVVVGVFVMSAVLVTRAA